MQSVNKKVASVLIDSGIDSDFFVFHKSARGGVYGRVLSGVENSFKFADILSKNKVTCVFNIAGYEVILFTIICIFKKMGFVYWEHGDPANLSANLTVRLLRSLFYKKAKAVVVLHRDYIAKINKKLSNVVCIPNVVPQLGLMSVDFEDKINSVVWVGRLGPEKNPGVAFDAMAHAAVKLEWVDFYFIFPFDDDSGFFAKPKPKNMHIVNGSDFNFRDYFNKNSLHLLTSRTEAMPGVLMESTSCLSRFISTDCSPWVRDLSSLGHGSVVPVDIDCFGLAGRIVDVVVENNLKLNPEKINNFLVGCNEKNTANQWRSLFFG